MTKQKIAQGNFGTFFLILVFFSIAVIAKNITGKCPDDFLFLSTCGDADTSSSQANNQTGLSPDKVSGPSLLQTAGSCVHNCPSNCRFDNYSVKSKAKSVKGVVSTPAGFDLSLAADYIPVAELVVIENAAKRNKCFGDDLLILLAIRKAENGRAGREFGVMHDAAIDTNLQTQAAWAAATVVKNRARWELEVITARKGRYRQTQSAATAEAGEFIEYLGKRYCPPGVHRLNRHWVRNVKYWYAKLKKINHGLHGLTRIYEMNLKGKGDTC